jgi:sortase (surface protein transpeptidase)
VNSNSIQIDTSGAGHQALILITCWPVDSPVPGGEERWVVEAVRLR